MEKETFPTQPHRPQWKTRSGFLLAAIGSAIGLGNIWRFSYMCYANGGGAFLIPYFLALFTAGIPLMILEYGIGHKMRGSAPMTFAKISRHWEWLGWWAVTFVMFGIVLYYCVVISWCLSYVIFSFTLPWQADPNAFFFQKFLGLTSGPGRIGDVRTPILFSLGLVWFLNWFIVFWGVEKGIERANKIFIPLLLVLTFILVAWSLRLPGAKAGIAKYLKPDFSILSRPRVWIDAFSQIFFTLSLGFGIMIAYASYLPRKNSIVQNAFITSFANCAYSLFAGFAVFGTLGYMAYQTAKPFEQVVQQSIGLAFVAYPQAISLLPYFPSLFGVLFFTTLLVAGISSSVSILEAFSSAMIDKFHYSRKSIVTALSIIGFLGGIIFTTGGGLYWLDIVDHFLTHYGLVVVGFLECIVIGWIFGARRLREHIRHISGLVLGRWWDICVKFFTPIILTTMLINDFLDEVAHPYGGYSWLAIILIGRDWLLLTLIVAFIVSLRAWRVELHIE
jgi:NSS family neurotransmitter:Na+ symporter